MKHEVAQIVSLNAAEKSWLELLSKENVPIRDARKPATKSLILRMKDRGLVDIVLMPIGRDNYIKITPAGRAALEQSKEK